MRLTLDLHLHSQASPDGRMTVEEIAAKTGFFYAEYFCVAFKRHTSMVPSEYRKLNNTNISMNRQHKNPYAHVD